MPDAIPLTFKASPELDRKICGEMGFHDLNRSDFVRQCIRGHSRLLRVCPELLKYDDQRLDELMEKVGKIVVILENFQR